MNNQFDELAKGLAQSVTRRGALKKFGVGLAGVVLTTMGFTEGAEAKLAGCLPAGASCRRAHSGANRCCSGVCVGDGDSASKYGYCV